MSKFFGLSLILGSFLYASTGEDIFKSKCSSCHSEYVPFEQLIENFEKHDNKLLNLKAPTLNQMSFRLKTNIGDPKGDEEIHLMEVVEFITDYSINPDKSKTVCLNEVIKHFDTMPSLKGKISEDELEAVGEYIYYANQNREVSDELKWQNVSNVKNDDKLYLVEVMSSSCYYCKNMDKTVFTDKEVIKSINSFFTPIRINKSNESIDSRFKTSFVPTFFFYKNGKVIKKLPGAWKKDDFLSILNKIKDNN
jgi:thioredoxin-related protein